MISPLLSNATVLILFLLPMITMRTYSEEKRSGTIELLLTSPLKDVEIILGKFLGAMGMYLRPAGGDALSTWASCSSTGNPAWKPLLSGYLGPAAASAAGSWRWGSFISSLTNNQMVAGAASFVVFLLFWIISWFGDSVGPTHRRASCRICRSPSTSMTSARASSTPSTSCIYLSFIAFGLFLTTKSVDTERWRG